MSHGRLGQAMLASAEMICGTVDDAATVDLQPGETPEALGDRVRAAVGDGAQPVLVLTDLVGGTPHNVAILICAEAAVEGRQVACVSGANLGVLIEAATSLASLEPASIAGLVERGRDGLVDVMARLAEQRAARRNAAG